MELGRLNGRAFWEKEQISERWQKERKNKNKVEEESSVEATKAEESH